MDDTTGAAVGWLLLSAEPAIRLLARRDLLGEDTACTGEVQDRGGGFGVHPYRKWTGPHWRLVSLVELGMPAGEPRAVRAAGTVLGWLTGREHRSSIVTVGGLVRCHASQEGNALAVCSRLGLGRDPRAELLAESLVRWQWPDGGWNCDPRATGRRSSFHESLAPARRGSLGILARDQRRPARPGPVLDLSSQIVAGGEEGLLVFGPDRRLYVGLGDGGGDPDGNGQSPGTLLGKILRIDPRPGGGHPYRIPAGNPLADRAGARPEIWDYGLRNPWWFSFDPATGELWIGDVGQNLWEEVDHEPAEHPDDNQVEQTKGLPLTKLSRGAM